MFEHLKEKPVILVTGPQRSGTRLIAKAISHDTGHIYIDEVEIKTDSVYELLWQIHLTDDPHVIQCPGLCHLAPALVKAHEEFFLVMCIRDKKEVIASQKRINWEWEWLERLKYFHRSGMLFPRDNRSLTHIKYETWKIDRRYLSSNQYLEVYYEDMKNHPLWVPKEQRKDWGFSQTEIER